MATHRQNRQNNTNNPILLTGFEGDRRLLDEQSFRRFIAIERKRTERSKTPFVLMLLEYETPETQKRADAVLHSAANALIQSSRDTDTVGWY